MINARSQQFLSNNGLDAESIEIDALLKTFEAEMLAGLRGVESSLPMIPAFISTAHDVPVEKSVIVMDAGGTNLRVSVLHFDANGEYELEEFSKHPMPALEEELGAEAFFEQMAAYLRPVADRSDRIGLCFSYPTEITPECDGRLLRWTKQVRAPEVVGKHIGRNLLKRLDGDEPGHKLTLLNDSVATLLAGRAAGISRRYSSYVGFILGTGTNTAYVEQNHNIAKLDDVGDSGNMVINVESGSFSGAPRSAFDKEFDARTTDSGAYSFEKMISGAYMGGLGLQVLKRAATEGLFSGPAAAVLDVIDNITTAQFDDYVDNPYLTSTPFTPAAFTDADRAIVLQLGQALFLRAAKFTAANIAAAVLRSGAGHDPLHPVSINIDGSTYYKTRTLDFRSLVEGMLHNVLRSRGISYDIQKSVDGPLIGAAVAALTQNCQG